MEHKCDRCEKPAQVHEVRIKNGKKHEIHLCPECAAAEGYGSTGGPMASQFAKAIPVPAQAQKRRITSCSTCGLSIAKFRHHGVLGCPSCYQAFEKHLEPLISRAQGGATHHCGHIPERQEGHMDRQLQRSKLLKKLNEAIAAEQYERAAEIRDSLQGLGGSMLGGEE